LWLVLIAIGVAAVAAGIYRYLRARPGRPYDA
jgi:hypothetical protein